MPIQSYNPSVFIQRIESVGDNASKQIVVNTLSTIKVADSVNILGVDYLVEQLDSHTNTITLDKDRDTNINLISNPTIEVKHNAHDSDVALDNPIPISDRDRRDKLITLGKDMYQRILNKEQEILGNDYYSLRALLDSETRAYLGTFNAEHTPIISIFAKAESKTTDAIATEYKKKLVEVERAASILRTQCINLTIKVYQAQSKQELDAISFV